MRFERFLYHAFLIGPSSTHLYLCLQVCRLPYKYFDPARFECAWTMKRSSKADYVHCKFVFFQMCKAIDIKRYSYTHLFIGSSTAYSFHYRRFLHRNIFLNIEESFYYSLVRRPSCAYSVFIRSFIWTSRCVDTGGYYVKTLLQ